MRNTNPWTAFAVAVPLILSTAITTLASPEESEAPNSDQMRPAATHATSGAYTPDDVTVVIELNDADQHQSQLDREPLLVATKTPQSPGARHEAGNGLLSRIRDVACRYLGTPYRWGGTTPRAFDCSGFTRYVYAQLDIHLPRTAREQYRAGDPVKAGTWRTGDLVFFDMGKSYVSHVGLYLGGNTFIHASTPATGVRIDSLKAPSYKKNYVGARRFSA